MTPPDTLPPHLERAALAWARYKRMMRWMTLAAAAAVALALLYLSRSGDPMPMSMVIATIAGVGLSVLLGTGLMGLVFLSNSGGHDEAMGAPLRRPGEDAAASSDRNGISTAKRKAEASSRKDEG